METEEHWLKTYWRPVAAWGYLAICLFDFMIAPIVLVFFAKVTGTPLVMWHPITLEGSGLFHLSFGSIITTASWQRGNEKMKALEIAATATKV